MDMMNGLTSPRDFPFPLTTDTGYMPNLDGGRLVNGGNPVTTDLGFTGMDTQINTLMDAYERKTAGPDIGAMNSMGNEFLNSMMSLRNPNTHQFFATRFAMVQSTRPESLQRDMVLFTCHPHNFENMAGIEGSVDDEIHQRELQIHSQMRAQYPNTDPTPVVGLNLPEMNLRLAVSQYRLIQKELTNGPLPPRPLMTRPSEKPIFFRGILGGPANWLQLGDFAGILGPRTSAQSTLQNKLPIPSNIHIAGPHLVQNIWATDGHPVCNADHLSLCLKPTLVRIDTPYITCVDGTSSGALGTVYDKRVEYIFDGTRGNESTYIYQWVPINSGKSPSALNWLFDRSQMYLHVSDAHDGTGVRIKRVDEYKQHYVGQALYDATDVITGHYAPDRKVLSDNAATNVMVGMQREPIQMMVIPSDDARVPLSSSY